MESQTSGFLRTGSASDRLDSPATFELNPGLHSRHPGSAAKAGTRLSGKLARCILPVWLATTGLLPAAGLHSDELAPSGSWSFDSDLQSGHGNWTGSIQESGSVPAAGAILGSGCYSATGAGFIQTDLAGPTGDSARSVSIWFRTDPSTGSQDLLWGWGGTGSSGRYDLRVEGRTMRIETGSQEGTFVVPAAVNDGQWHHALLAFPGGGFRTQLLYIDGLSVAGLNVSGTVNTLAGNVRIGTGVERTRFSSSRDFSGLIDDFALFDRNLDASDAALIHGLGRFGIDIKSYAPARRVWDSPSGETALIDGRMWFKQRGLGGKTGSHGGSIAAGRAWIILDAAGNGIAYDSNSLKPTFPVTGTYHDQLPEALEWVPHPEATAYRIYVSTSASDLAAEPPSDDFLLGTSSSPIFGDLSKLPLGQILWWRVIAETPGGAVAGAVENFTLAFPRVAAAGMEAAFSFDSSRGAVRDGRFVVGANGSVITGSFDPSSRTLSFNQRLLGSGNNDDFGLAVNLDEPDLLLVGVPNSPAPGVSSQGETTAFHAGPAGTWHAGARQSTSAPMVQDRFGESIAAEGGHVFIGIPTFNSSQRTGAVEIFRRAPAWQSLGKITPSGIPTNSRFGAALAVSGNRLVVGAPGVNPGRAVVFEFDRASASWEQAATLAAPIQVTRGFGDKVEVRGDLAAVRGLDATGAGVVTLFRRNAAGTWLRESVVLKSAFTGSGQRFAHDMRLHDDLLLISDPTAVVSHSGSPVSAGAVFTRRRLNGTWSVGVPLLGRSTELRSFGIVMDLRDGWLLLGGNDPQGFTRKTVAVHRLASDAGPATRLVGVDHLQAPAGRPWSASIPLAGPDGEAPAADSFSFHSVPDWLAVDTTSGTAALLSGDVPNQAGTTVTLRMEITAGRDAPRTENLTLEIVDPAALPTISGLPPQIELVNGDDLSIKPQFDGLRPMTWQWFKNGEPLIDQTGESLFLRSPSMADAGSFHVTATNALGQVASASVEVEIAPTDRHSGTWTTVAGGPEHRGHTPASFGQHRFIKMWERAFDPGFSIAPCAIAEDTLFAATSHWNSQSPAIHALDLASGAEKWRIDGAASSSYGPPTWHDGNLIVQLIANPSRLLKINAADGAQIWSAPWGNQSAAYLSPVANADGIWMGGGTFGGVYGFSQSGDQRFFASAPQVSGWTPTLSGDRLFTMFYGRLESRSTVTGEVSWSYNPLETGGLLSAGTVASGGDVIVYCPSEEEIHAVNARTGALLWKSRLAMLLGQPLIAGERVLAADRQGGHELSLRDGRTLHYYPTGIADPGSSDDRPFSILATTDHLIVASRSQTRIHHFASGDLVQTIDAGGALAYDNAYLTVVSPPAGLSGTSMLRVYRCNAPPASTAALPSAIPAGDAAGDAEIPLGNWIIDDDPGESLTWAIEDISRPEIFRSISIQPSTGDLEIAYNPWTHGSSEVTIIVTDSAGHFTRTTVTFTVPPHTDPGLQVAAKLTLNRQTGLYEHQITVTNTAAREIAGFDLALTGLPAGVTINNASAMEGGVWAIHHRQPLAAGASVTLLVEYFTPVRGTEINPEVAVALVGEPANDPVAGEAGLAVDRCEVLADQSLLIEFTALPGSLYEIQYSDHSTNWKTSPVTIRAAGNRVQWIDRGPPRTDTPPATKSSRLYRVREITTP